MRYLAALILALIPALAHAQDKVVSGTVQFKLFMGDTTTAQNGIPGFTDANLTSLFNIKVQCGSNAATTLTAASTVTEDAGLAGVYIIDVPTATDAITNNPEEECIHWVEGASNYAGLIAYTPGKFKAIANTTAGIPEILNRSRTP